MIQPLWGLKRLLFVEYALHFDATKDHQMSLMQPTAPLHMSEDCYGNNMQQWVIAEEKAPHPLISCHLIREHTLIFFFLYVEKLHNLSTVIIAISLHTDTQPLK